MTKQPKKALVIGCGIGGAAVGLFLQRAGIEVEIYEASSVPDEYSGLFLNVASNGLAVLATLDLDRHVAAEGFSCPQMVMWSGSGKRLGEVRNGAAPEQGAASMIIKRGTLHRILREEAERQGIPILFGKQLTTITSTPQGGVGATFADGTQASGDVLIGCDGIYSRTRPIMDSTAPKPAYTGLVSCGGFSRGVGLPPTLGTQHFIFGKRAFFGYLVKPDGEIFWFTNLAEPQELRRAELEAIPEAAWQQRLLALHQDDQPFIQDIIRATQGPIGRYAIYDIPSLPRWHSGPIVLLGDAVHAPSPSAGQGASLALEDAIILAQCLRDRAQVGDAFSAYERLRRARVERVVQESRKLGSTKAMSNPIARWLRDLLLPFFLKRLAHTNALDWLYTYTVAWDAPVMAAGEKDADKMAAASIT